MEDDQFTQQGRALQTLRGCKGELGSPEYFHQLHVFISVKICIMFDFFTGFGSRRTGISHCRQYIFFSSCSFSDQRLKIFQFQFGRTLKVFLNIFFSSSSFSDQPLETFQLKYRRDSRSSDVLNLKLTGFRPPFIFNANFNRCKPNFISFYALITYTLPMTI